MTFPYQLLPALFLLSALLVPVTVIGEDQQPRFRVEASLQADGQAMRDPRFSLRGQFIREASAVTVRDTGLFSLTARFAPGAATCVIPDFIFRDRFQLQP